MRFKKYKIIKNNTLTKMSDVLPLTSVREMLCECVCCSHQTHSHNISPFIGKRITFRIHSRGRRGVLSAV